MIKTRTLLAKTMASEESRNWAIKIVGGTFATIIAPVLVGLWLKWMDRPADAPNANQAAAKPAPTAGQIPADVTDAASKPKPNDPSTAPVAPRAFGAFKPLFNGRDLAGWTAEDRRWRVDAANQTLIGEDTTGVRKYPRSWIFTERTFTDFGLRFEYRIGPKTDSGIMLRMPAGGSLDEHYEIQLSYNENQQIATGSILGLRAGPGHPHTRPITPIEQRPEWNQVQIELRGQHLRVTINGQLAHDLRFDQNLDQNLDQQSNNKTLSDTGRIGLQSRIGHVEFRKIEIQE